MKALVLGAGKVGLGIAQYLADQGTDVTIIEKSMQKVEYIKRFTSIPVVLGNALDIKVVEPILSSGSSHLIATMSQDEQNILACKIIGSHFNVSTKIARIRSHIFTQDESFRLFIKNNFDIDTIIQPEVEVAKNIMDIVPIKNAFNVGYLSHTVVISLKCLENTEVLNTPMKHFENISSAMFYILNIKRDGETFIPSSDDVLLSEDEVYFATTKEHLSEVLRLFGYSLDYKQNVLIVGGGRVGETLVHLLNTQYPEINVTVVEKSHDHAAEIAQRYPNVTVMPGDAQDYHFLQDAAHDIDTAILSMDDEKNNIIASMFLKQFNVARVFVLSNNPDHEKLLESVPGAFIINPNAITVQNIVRHSQKINKTEFFAIDQSLYVVESKIEVDSQKIGKNISMSHGAVPFFVIHDGDLLRAKKNYKLSAGDVVISFNQHAEKIFSDS